LINWPLWIKSGITSFLTIGSVDACGKPNVLAGLAGLAGFYPQYKFLYCVI
jgi:hypothetical protein